MALSDFLNLNEIVNDEAAKLRIEFPSRISSFGMKHNSKTKSDSILNTRVRVGERFGVADKISIKFPRHGVFVEKGVGRGGSANRTPAQWFNPTVAEAHQRLTERIAEALPGAALQELKRILIK